MRNRAAFVAVVVAAVVLAACGSSATTAPTTIPTTAPPTVESPTPELASPSPAEVATPTPAAAYTIYVVKKGDTLYAIARAHHTTIAKILALNPSIKDAAKIRIGEKIKVPTA